MEERELRSLEAKNDTSSEAVLERSAPNRRLHERTHSAEDATERQRR